MERFKFIRGVCTTFKVDNIKWCHFVERSYLPIHYIKIGNEKIIDERMAAIK